jgi:Immunity protein 8
MQKPLVQAELKKLHSPDVLDLMKFQPEGPFGFLLQAMVGPLGSNGEESFDVMVCTPEWFSADMKSDIVSGRHFLFMRRYDYRALKNFIREYCASCHGESWHEVARRLDRLGQWEFEDYQPSPGAAARH